MRSKWRASTRKAASKRRPARRMPKSPSCMAQSAPCASRSSRCPPRPQPEPEPAKMDQPTAKTGKKKSAADSDAQQRRRLHTAELLLTVSHRMAEFDTLDEVLNALVEMTTTQLNASRGSLFLNDPSTNELYSRAAQGNIQREIRILNTSGIAGFVFTSGEPLIIHDAYSDSRFNRSIDEQTGFVTQNILCVPIKTLKGEVIGVAQTLNKRKGNFTTHDLHLLQAMT